MDYLVRSRAAPAAMEAADDPALDERHWAYMDGFRLTARGPTLGVDRCTWTGSIHVVDLPDPDAARQFVAGEPYHQAGAYQQHLIWRFSNVLGRTMAQFAAAEDELRFFVLARTGRPDSQDAGPVPLADLSPRVRERLIVYGGLHDLDDDALAGVALAVQVRGREELDQLLAGELAWIQDLGTVEILDWEFGGRR